MDCDICNRTDIENDAVKTIWEGEVVNACKNCALREQLPIIKKATQEQVDASNVHYSVRERMERMTKKPTVMREQAITHKNLSKLHFPGIRQDHESLVQNYDWELKTTRRRKKLSIAQLALASGLVPEDIQKLENGQIVDNLETVATRLENTLGIILLKKTSKIVQSRLAKTEQEIIEEVVVNADEIANFPKKKNVGFFKKLFSKPDDGKVELEVPEETEEIVQEKKEIFNKIASGKMDFSKRKDLEKITLKDLAEMKKRKEKGEMFGSDLEVEED
jgi:ribosome-binding protein aMBF1 (putative translation factor)